ncbi:MAG: hypothetical protein M1824_003188 [Vezdaea acicularis]|nr:MAG: hypothetical protein M1824_003188 [Vezdaea acicularis]
MYILLVPTTEVLLSSKDRDSNTLYSDLAGSEEFLGSHVLRLPGGKAPDSEKHGANMRDTRNKAKQFTTVNGRTVVVKEGFVYSNKGFKMLNQAQLLNDIVWYPDSLDGQQWLIYFISRPLIGSFEPVVIATALDPGSPAQHTPSRAVRTREPNGSPISPRKKDISSFSDLLNNFPMIARQMQPGLERVFKEFSQAVEKPLPNPPIDPPNPGPSEETHTPAKVPSNMSSSSSELSNGRSISPMRVADYAEDEEDEMRKALETAVTAAIDLFQLVDKQQLSHLGATTDLTGSLVERLIEQYVTEQVHDSILFPRLRAIKRAEDHELESSIRQMEYVDVSQVGIHITGGRAGKMEVIRRLEKGVEQFRKLGVAGSPQEMLEILLATEKTVAMAVPPGENEKSPRINGVEPEKPNSVLTVNADTLVSLLLVVVIRSQVRHLQARLSYMRNFIFIDDVESGELGYALSTFEAVLSYLAKDAGGLRRSSRRNRHLWQATKEGDISAIREILEPEQQLLNLKELSDEPSSMENNEEAVIDGSETLDGRSSPRSYASTSQTYANDSEHAYLSTSDASTLNHVFPFQNRQSSFSENDVEIDLIPIRKGKKVAMDMRSLSSSSAHSFQSGTNTLDSRGSGIEGDTSIERLSKTQDSSGDSVLMMAVENQQPHALNYLINLNEYFSLETVLEDANNEGTTLLSAAIQLGHTEMIEIILEFLSSHVHDEQPILSYFARTDHRGRTIGHYLFNAPHLISKIGHMISWTCKDRNGQTPLFALCRSYDHPDYVEMVEKGVAAAVAAQNDGKPLHLDDHVDGKGNTLLHVVSDPHLAQRLLRDCDSDVNATNDKRFTPLMVASKYGRTDMVRCFFDDPRVDMWAKELRGFTAVELAKDDEVRNRIDDLVLLANPLDEDNRVTAVVRSYFVEDATVRLVLKSAVLSGVSMYTVTTCRRSLADFENLAKWLSVEYPASWLPAINSFRTPFQIPSRPSRAVLRDIQIRLDNFLKVLLSHSTFSKHELLWEFLLVPDIQPEMMAERSQKKAETRLEKLRDEYSPIEDVRDVETFVGYAKDMVRGVSHSTRSVLRRINQIKNISTDLFDAQRLTSNALSTFPFIPTTHLNAFTRFSLCLAPTEHPPLAHLHFSFLSISSTLTALLTSLARPTALISSIATTQASIRKHHSSLRRSDRWPLGLLDDTRAKVQVAAAEKVEKAEEQLQTLGKELRYTQQTVAGELAGWQDGHEKRGRAALREFARGMVIRERARLEAMKRAVRGVVEVREDSL